RGALAWCGFDAATGISANVVDVSAERATPGAAVALSTDLDALTSQVWESVDDGKSFAPLGEPLANFIGVTIDVAPTSSAVIYVSGVSANSTDTSLRRSGDHGQSFKIYPVPSKLLVDAWPYISAMDPKDPDTVYVRSNSAPGTLLVTRDGGQN